MAKNTKSIPKPIQNAPVQPHQSIKIPFVLIAGMGIMCCVYTLRVMDPVMIPKFWAYSVFIFALFLGLWIKGKTQDLSDLLNQNALLWASVAYIGISGVIGIYGASMLGDALLEWGKWALGALGMWGIVAFYRKKGDFRELVCQCISIFTLIICAIAMYDATKLISANNLTHSTSYNINSLFGHKNIFCEVLFLMLPFNLYLVFYGKKIARFLGMIAAILAMVFMIALLSRAIWIALALSSAITGMIYLFIEFLGKRQNSIQLKKIGLFAGASLAIILMSLGLYATFSKGDAIQRQLSSITNVYHSANQDRLKKWQQTWQLFEEEPFTGIGIGDWKVEILKFITKNSEIEAGKLFFQRPHNDYLWVLSETGIFSFIAYLSIFGVAIFMVFRLLKRTENIATRNWLYLLLHGILGYLIFSAFAFPKERIEEIFFLHLIFAAILYEYDAAFAKENGTKTRTIPTTIALIISAVCIYVGYERFDGESELRQFETTNKAGKYDLALQHAINAYRPMLEMDPISTPIRFFSGTLYLQMKKFPIAKEHLEAAHTLSPYHVQVMNNLAGLYFMTQETEKSRALYEKVLLYAPKYEDALLSLTAISYNSKDIETAFYYLSQIDTASINPRYKQYAENLIPKISASVSSRITEPNLLAQVTRIFDQKIWYLGLGIRAKAANRDITKQSVFEAITEMLRLKTISLAESEALKQKYGL